MRWMYIALAASLAFILQSRNTFTVRSSSSEARSLPSRLPKVSRTYAIPVSCGISDTRRSRPSFSYSKQLRSSSKSAPVVSALIACAKAEGNSFSAAKLLLTPTCTGIMASALTVSAISSAYCRAAAPLSAASGPKRHSTAAEYSPSTQHTHTGHSRSSRKISAAMAPTVSACSRSSLSASLRAASSRYTAPVSGAPSSVSSFFTPAPGRFSSTAASSSGTFCACSERSERRPATSLSACSTAASPAASSVPRANSESARPSRGGRSSVTKPAAGSFVPGSGYAGAAPGA